MKILFQIKYFTEAITENSILKQTAIRQPLSHVFIWEKTQRTEEQLNPCQSEGRRKSSPNFAGKKQVIVGRRTNLCPAI